MTSLVERLAERLSLLNKITKSTSSTEKRLQTDLKRAKNAYEAGDIEVVYVSRSEQKMLDF